MVNHCGCHFTVPNSAAASGIHRANSASRTGNLFFGTIAGRINSGSISIAWYILSPGSTRMVTSPERRLRVGGAPCESWAVSAVYPSKIPLRWSGHTSASGAGKVTQPDYCPTVVGSTCDTRQQLLLFECQVTVSLLSVLQFWSRLDGLIFVDCVTSWYTHLHPP